jgi:small-conductance mechanosensitive channel
MEPQTEKPDPSKWSIASLDKYLTALIDERDRSYQHRYDAQEKAVAAALSAQERLTAQSFAAQEKAVAAALSAAERAVNKAEVAAEKRFDSVAEFRQALSDQAMTMLPRPEFDRAILALYDRLDTTSKGMTEKIDDLRSSRDAKIAELATSRDITAGRSGGINAGWVYLVGFVSLLSLLYNLFFLSKK